MLGIECEFQNLCVYSPMRMRILIFLISPVGTNIIKMKQYISWNRIKTHNYFYPEIYNPHIMMKGIITYCQFGNHTRTLKFGYGSFNWRR